MIAEEKLGVRDGLRRTYEISRPHWKLVLVLVVIPLGIEHALAEAVRELVDEGGIVPESCWASGSSPPRCSGHRGVIDVSLRDGAHGAHALKFSHPKRHV